MCHPDRELLVAVGCLLVFGFIFLFCYFGVPKKDLIPLVLGVGICLLAFWLAAWILRSRVVADGAGIRWRHLGRERTAEWSEIRDYYLVPNTRQGFPGLEAGQGKFSLCNWTERDAFMTMVQEHAIHARVKNWDLQGIRLEDEWPRCFTYRSRLNNWIPAFLVAFLGLSVLRLLSTRAWSQPLASIALMWRWNGPAMTIAYIVVGAFVVLAQPAVLFVLMWPRWRQSRARSEESFLVTPTELTWKQGAASQSVRMQDISRYFMNRPGDAIAVTQFVVETGRESLQWTLALPGCQDLTRIITRFATNSATTGWEDIEVIRKKQQRQEIHATTGERVFTYRNNANRAMLFLYTTMMSLFAPLQTASYFIPFAPRRPVIGELAFAYLLLLCAAVIWWWYLTSNVVVNGEGIVSKTPFGTRKISWGSLEEAPPVGKRGDMIFVIKGTNANIGIFTALDGAEELRAMIGEHLAPR